MAKNTVEVGKRLERAIVKALEALGYQARRQPGSGNRDVDLQHDVVWKDSPIGKLHIECKFKSKSTWKTCENDRDGADILVMREARDVPKVFMDWDTFLQLVGSAADRSEHLHELPEVVPDKPWVTESLRDSPECPDCHKYQWHCLTCDRPVKSDNSHYSPDFFDPLAIAQEQDRRARIQSAHQNPPQRKPEPNKLRGRGFGK